MRYNDEWKDFEVIATGDGEKLERWGKEVLLRPDPQVIWLHLNRHFLLNAIYLT